MLFLYLPPTANGTRALPPPGCDFTRPWRPAPWYEPLWPLLLAKLDADTTPESFDDYLDLRTECLRRGEPHVSIIDARAATIRLAPLRLRFIAWLRAHERALRECSLGSAYVLNTPEGHMLASLIRHGGSMQSPFYVSATMPEAVAWAAERLQERGLSDAARRVRAHYTLPTS